MKSLPRVAIIGRPNVGKSTLFNRLVGRRVAIVDSTPGVTRDRIYGIVEWNERSFGLVDTAGIISQVLEKFHEEVQLQVEVAIEESDLLLFVVDASEGPTAGDEDLVRFLRRTGKPVVVAANKIDARHRVPLEEFHRWGFEYLIDVSALRGIRSGDLLDLLVAKLPVRVKPDTGIPENAVRVAVIGKPNVGKSSLVNRLVGEERAVVSDVAGTTRDPVDTVIRYHGLDLALIDTAGLRKKMKTARGLDYYTLMRTIGCIERCDLAVLMLDAREAMTRQDLRIADMTIENGKSLILVVNKWDLVEGKDSKTSANIEKELKKDFPHLAHVPVIFASALTAQRLGRLLRLVVDISKERRIKIPQESLNEFLGDAVENFHPPAVEGRRVVLHGCRQLATAPPLFEIYASRPEGIPEHYRRYLVNRLRERFPFPGTPVRLRFARRKEKKKSRH